MERFEWGSCLCGVTAIGEVREHALCHSCDKGYRRSPSKEPWGNCRACGGWIVTSHRRTASCSSCGRRREAKRVIGPPTKPTPVRAAEPSRLKVYGVVIPLVIVGVAIFSWMSWNADNSSPDPEPAPVSDTTESEYGDASAKVSCRHFRNIADDVRAGVLNDFELRDKLREVHESARVSETPGIASGAQAMLAAITRGDSDALATSVAAFSSACSGVG